MCCPHRAHAHARSTPNYSIADIQHRPIIVSLRPTSESHILHHQITTGDYKYGKHKSISEVGPSTNTLRSISLLRLLLRCLGPQWCNGRVYRRPIPPESSSDRPDALRPYT